MPSSTATTEKPAKTPPPPPPPTNPIPTKPAANDLVTTMSLGEVLRALSLEHAASLLDVATSKAIARNDSPTSLLDYLMREQLRSDSEKRAQVALKRSAIFPLTTLDTYDFDYPKSIDRDLVMRAAELAFIDDKTNCVFVGPSGVGKTHLANAIGQLACVRGYRVRFVLASDLVNDLVAGQARNTLHRRILAWTSPDLLLVDELGYLSFDARGADLLYQVFNRRYQRASTVVTTNLAFKDWGKLFHSTAAASAIADRLVHKGLLIRIQGKSRRSDQEVDSE
jgi:DNA replication protein DnaC